MEALKKRLLSVQTSIDQNAKKVDRLRIKIKAQQTKGTNMVKKKKALKKQIMLTGKKRKRNTLSSSSSRKDKPVSRRKIAHKSVVGTKKATKATKNTNICNLCFVKKSTIRCVPCGHHAICLPCFKVKSELIGTRKKVRCPRCGKAIRSVKLTN